MDMNEPDNGVPKNADGTPKYGPGSRFRGRPKRSGRPVEHGLYAAANNEQHRHGMVGGRLPKGCRYVECRTNALRRQLEEAVLALRGIVSLVDASIINSAVKWERHGLLASNWLRKEIDKLGPSDRLKFSEAIAKASDSRDRNIRALKLDHDAKEKILAHLYHAPLPPADGAGGPGDK